MLKFNQFLTKNISSPIVFVLLYPTEFRYFEMSSSDAHAPHLFPAFSVSIPSTLILTKGQSIVLSTFKINVCDLCHNII